MACVLLATVPSGEVELVRLRSELSSRLRLPRLNVSRALRPAILHGDRPVGQDASRLVYVGCGRNDPQGRPSPYYNPFFFLNHSEAEANDLYGKWLSCRMDLSFFLHPLLGRALLCDCHRGLGCHVHTLLRVLDNLFPLPGSCERHYGYVDYDTSVPTFSPSTFTMPLKDVRRENLSDSDDSGTEVQVVTVASKPDEIRQIDETRRGSFNAMHFGSERPAWPKAWRTLIAAVRLLNCMCFWEVFSGVTVLTGAFADAGWAVAPPLTSCTRPFEPPLPWSLPWAHIRKAHQNVARGSAVQQLFHGM